MSIKEILGTTKLITQNTKLKTTSKELGERVYNFSIPAYKSNTGKVICPFAGECKKYCYAQKGRFVFSNVQNAFEKRYQATKHIDFVEAMIEEIKRVKATFIRIHDSGDFYSPEYRNKWIDIALALPDVKFYAYTKSFPLFIGLQLPSNFDVIFSQGSKLDGIVDVSNYRHSRIFQSKEELEKFGYTDASKIDLYATKWYSENKKIGLIFH